MQAILVLGDFAERDSVTGKVHILGAGWSLTGPTPAPQSVILFVKIPAERASTPIPVRLRLLDDGGQVVTITGAAGVQPLDITGQIELKEPDRLDPGSADVDAVFSVNIAPLPLQPGTAYKWRADLDGEEAAVTEFRVRTA
jgi:hypothetical protein